MVSLTFDDGLPCQRDFALPVLNSHRVPATFFLPSNSEEYPMRPWWKDFSQNGHEVGSHSVTHRKAATLTPADMDYETGTSRNALEQVYGIPAVVSYCYPYTDAPQSLQASVRRAAYTQARGGRGARDDKFLTPGDGVNLFNVPSFHVGPYTVPLADKWAEEAQKRNAWVVLMLHGVGDPRAWDNISTFDFEKLINAFKNWGVEFKTFAEAAEIYRCAT